MIATVLAMLVKPNRLRPKTTTLRVLQGIFFFLPQLLLILIIVLQNVGKNSYNW